MYKDIIEKLKKQLEEEKTESALKAKSAIPDCFAST